ANGIEKVQYMGGGHITSPAKCSAGFTRCRFIVFHNFSTTVVKNVFSPVNENSSFTSEYYCSPVAQSVSIMSRTASAIPFDNSVACKTESGIHGVVHFPAIGKEMAFPGFHIHTHRKID